MAGIGFVLRRLARQDDLAGGVQAYTAAAAVTSGPWLLTVVAILAADWWGRDAADMEVQGAFRTVLSYNFCFSLVLTAPFAVVASRIAADRIFAERIDSLGSLFVQALSAALAVQMPLALLFWFLAVDMPLVHRMAAVANYASLVGLWTVVTFLSVLKDFRLTLLAVLLGMTLAALGAIRGQGWGAPAQLTAFTIGALTITFVGGGRVLLEFPWVRLPWTSTWAAAKHFPALALIGLLAAAAPWADKWVMWLSPSAETLMSGLRDFPNYDSAMFMAYLTMVPGIALFFVAVETEFFVHYRRYFDELLSGASLSRLEALRQALTDSVVRSGISLLLLQTLVAAVAVLLAPTLAALGVLTTAQFPIFQLGALGALFHTLLLATLIVLAYLDVRGLQLIVTGAFLVLNTVLPALLLPLAGRFHGYGYLLASMAALMIAAVACGMALRRLNYHVFIGNNPSLRPRRFASGAVP